jgi:hypothetical protein
MDKKESLLRQKAEAEKEAAQYENQVKILLNKQRDAERHAWNHRLIVHGAIVEGVFPFTASMDGESLKAFLIALSRLPGVWETAQTAQNAGDGE